MAQVEAVTYTGVGGTGFYNKVTNMDPISGNCTYEAYGYSGSLSPLNEEVRASRKSNLANQDVLTTGLKGIITRARASSLATICCVYTG